MSWKAILYGTIFVTGAGVSADPYHNINQIVGDRALGMAGAYGAISDDPAGMYYNPAGIAFANAASISANVNTLQSNSIRYEDVLGGVYDYQRSSNQVLPNFFGVIQPLGDWVVGFSNSIVDSTEEKQDQQFENFGNIERYVVNLNNIDTTYNVGPSFARRLTSQLAIGMSLHLHYRSSEFISNQFIQFDNTTNRDVEWTNLYLKATEQGIRPKFGVSYAPVDKINLGLTVDKAWVINANQTQQIAYCETNDTDVGCTSTSQITPSITEFADKRQYPWQVRLAGAWFANNAFLFSADMIYNSAVAEHVGYAAQNATIDGALGLEWYWSPQWALRTGAFTAFANTDPVVTGKTLQSPHVNRYGGSVGVTRFNQGSSISLGVLSQYGLGYSQLFADLPDRIQQTSSLGVTAYFTTSYRF